MRYIGSKTKLVQEIVDTVMEKQPKSSSLCDLFAGTGIVGQSFKRTHKIISNDLLYFAYVLNYSYIALKATPKFTLAKKHLKQHPVDFLNNLQINIKTISDEDFITCNYSPVQGNNRCYLTVENALHIDRARQLITEWYSSSLITEGEFHYLLASLIEEVPSVSNIAGTYGAYLKKWDKRSFKSLQLGKPEIIPTNTNNEIYNMDANQLITKISGDVLYLDTPYNGRQYSSNYHLLETIAKYDNPEIKGITGLRKDRSGESEYCRKGKVYDSYDHLLGNAKFKTIVMSYSSEGLLQEDEIIELMEKHFNSKTLNFKKIPYRRYKRLANDGRAHVLEFLISVNK